MGTRPATIQRCAWRRARACPRESGGGMDGTGGQRQQRDLGCLPDATEGKAARAAPGHLGQCASPPWGGHWQSVPGEQGGGAGEGRQIPGRAVQPERRGETALPDGPAIKGRNTPARLPPRFPAPGKCTSHLGFGLVLQRRIIKYGVWSFAFGHELAIAVRSWQYVSGPNCSRKSSCQINYRCNIN